MENIHILSTDKPSRLIKNNRGYALITDEFTQSDLDYIQAKFQHIYITNDEEIKRYGEYYLDIDTNEVKTSFENMGKYLSNEKKIILTTDPDLIKDGVQEIDDEFLEWFVKNPSCEFVEIEDSVWDGISKWIPYYDIIIPEEPNPCKDIVINDKAAIDVPFHNKHIRFENLTSEQAGYLLQVSEFYQLSGTRRSAVVPKEEFTIIKGGDDIVFPSSTTITVFKPLPDVNWESDVINEVWDEEENNAEKINQLLVLALKLPNEDLKVLSDSIVSRLPQEETKQIKCYCGHTITCDCEPLQETIEEFINQSNTPEGLDQFSYDKGLEDGAKWQQERMYIDIEVFTEELKDKIDSFEYSVNQNSYISDYIKEWFEQYKKK